MSLDTRDLFKKMTFKPRLDGANRQPELQGPSKNELSVFKKQKQKMK